MTAIAPALHLSTTSLHPVAVVALAGELDVAVSTALDAELTRRFAEHRNHVVLDLRGIEFVDSTGLSSLVRAMKALNRHGRRLAVVTAPGVLRRALEVTGLEHTFDVRPSVEDAIAALEHAPRIGRS